MRIHVVPTAPWLRSSGIKTISPNTDGTGNKLLPDLIDNNVLNLLAKFYNKKKQANENAVKCVLNNMLSPIMAE